VEGIFLNHMNSMIAEPFIKGDSQLLKVAVSKLKKMGYIHLRLLGDAKGVFSIEYPRFFLNAKKYFYENSIVSIQKEIVHRARILKKDVVVYVEQDNSFYIFDPQLIINDHWENIKGDPDGYHLLMYNWDVSLGRNLVL